MTSKEMFNKNDTEQIEKCKDVTKSPKKSKFDLLCEIVFVSCLAIPLIITLYIGTKYHNEIGSYYKRDINARVETEKNKGKCIEYRSGYFIGIGINKCVRWEVE